MEKMLVCDFDDTVKTSNTYITKLNFKAIKRFHDNGNKLVFASGRDFKSLKRALSYYKAPYDALICNDGSIGFDKNYNIIFHNKISEQDVLQLIYYCNTEQRKIINDVCLYDFKGYTENNNNILEVLIIPKLFKNIIPMLKELEKYFPNLKFTIFNGKIFVSQNCSKSDGIKEINKLFNVNKDNIYTIGNWKNDYEMIRDYNGYNVLISYPQLYMVSKGTVPTVAHLVKKLEKK